MFSLNWKTRMNIVSYSFSTQQKTQIRTKSMLVYQSNSIIHFGVVFWGVGVVQVVSNWMDYAENIYMHFLFELSLSIGKH